MAFHVHITTGAKVPIYQQIVDQIRLAVASGVLSPGDRLPSVRLQAERLLVNPNTVGRAYAELAREGVLRSEPGRGLFVAARRSVYKKSERLRRIKPALETLVNEALALDFSGDEIVGLLRAKLEELDLIPRTEAEDPL